MSLTIDYFKQLHYDFIPKGSYIQDKMKTILYTSFLVVILQYVTSINAVTQSELIHHVEADPELEAYLREAIENFREQMKEGIDAIQMPILDPLELSQLNINVRENLATLDLHIKTITVEGLSSFTFHDIYPDLESYFLKVNLTIPSVESWGTYDLNGKLLKIFPLKGNGNFQINITQAEIVGLTVQCLSIFKLTHLKPNLEEMYLGINLTLPEIYMSGNYSVNGKLVKILPIYGDGSFYMNATDIKISGFGQLAFTNETIQMSLLKLDLHWEHLAVNMENFLGGGSFAKVLQQVVPKVGRDIFYGYKPLIMEKLEKFMQEMVNEKLEEECVKDIIKVIIPQQ
ncbi:hypothetical protein JTE90_021612 [Oedothorax gibbosus]|uniref:Uncharacterized protein n=1 Tax=Oedothorax gibbosus TaxID=931172 RepID=A0AAV6VQF7_9ARAC|nr:hypothetical protein JTE90_021612 [Oedothorax gibbosus]